MTELSKPINHFLKSPYEKKQLKQIKMHYNLERRQINPEWTKHNSILGLRTEEFSQIKTILELAKAVDAQELAKS